MTAENKGTPVGGQQGKRGIELIPPDMFVKGAIENGAWGMAAVMDPESGEVIARAGAPADAEVDGWTAAVIMTAQVEYLLAGERGGDIWGVRKMMDEAMERIRRNNAGI